MDSSETWIKLDHPIFCVTKFCSPSFLEKDTRISPQIVICGGGGSSKTGVPNCIRVGGLERDEDGILHLKTLIQHNTEDQLISRIVCASNGKFLFGSTGNKTIVFRVVKGDDETSLKLEHVVSQVTDEKEGGNQSAIAVMKDDMTLLTGSIHGVLTMWRFEQNKDKEYNLKHLHSINLFEEGVSSISINSNDSFAAVGSERGSVAVIDLGTKGVVCRIPAESPRSYVTAVLFTAPNVFLAVVNERKTQAAIHQFTAVKDHENKWEKKLLHVFKNHCISSASYEEKKSLLMFGTNTGDVGAFKYPSFKAVQKFESVLGMAVTGITYLPPNPSLLTVSQRAELEKEESKRMNDDQGWIVASSITNYVMPIQLKEKSNSIVWVLFILFLLFIIWSGINVIMHTN